MPRKRNGPLPMTSAEKMRAKRAKAGESVRNVSVAIDAKAAAALDRGCGFLGASIATTITYALNTMYGAADKELFDLFQAEIEKLMPTLDLMNKPPKRRVRIKSIDNVQINLEPGLSFAPNRK
jgi:hypothetical protein